MVSGCFIISSFLFVIFQFQHFGMVGIIVCALAGVSLEGFDLIANHASIPLQYKSRPRERVLAIRRRTFTRSIFAAVYYVAAPALLYYGSFFVGFDSIRSLLVRHHQAISMSLYVSAVIPSSNDLAYLGASQLFALFCVCVAYFNCLLSFRAGLIWFFMPAVTQSANDACSYFVGKYKGKHPLSPLSPNKTWEGYLGGALLSAPIGVLIFVFASHYPWLSCPIDVGLNGELLPVCSTDDLVEDLKALRPRGLVFVSLISLCVVLLAPLFGLFASGLKRAVGIKNYSSLIPGHGGLIDRLDSIIVLAVGLSALTASISKESGQLVRLREKVLFSLDTHEQVVLHQALNSSLAIRNLIGDSAVHI